MADLSATNAISLPASKLITQLSNSTTFQTLVGLTPPDAAGALAFIHYPSEEGDTFTRPCALVGDGDDWMAQAVAIGSGFTYAYEGALWLAIEADIASAYRAAGEERNAHYWFANRVGAIVEEALALAGTSTHLCIREVRRLVLGRVSKSEEEAGDFWYRAEFAVEWQ